MNSPVRTVKQVQLVEVTSCWGEGIVTDPCRIVTEYFNMEGDRVAVSDPFMEDLTRNITRQSKPR